MKKTTISIIASAAALCATSLVLGLIVLTANPKRGLLATDQPTTIVVDEPNDPSDPTVPDDPTTPDDPSEPGEPDDPSDPGEPNEPEVTVPELVPGETYHLGQLVEWFKQFPEELNGTQVTVRARICGYASGARGACWFQDESEEAITRGSQITQERMVNMMVRPDEGNNNNYYYNNVGKITVITGVLTYEHSTFFGVDCLFMR